MKRLLETSDAYYDARTSSNPEKLKDDVEELADKPITYIDNDYLNLLRFLTGQSAKRQTTDHTEGDRNGGETHSLICEGQQPNTDFQNDDGVDVQQKRSQCTEIDRDYAVLVANTRPLEGEDDYRNEDELNLRHWLSGDKQAPHEHTSVEQRSATRDNAVQDGLCLEEAVDRRVPMSPRRIVETSKRKHCEASEGYNEAKVEDGIESFVRNYNEVKRPKKWSQT